MKNPSGNKLEKLVFGMFDQMVEGADKYVTKQDSTWLIFTEDKRWVIEFTNDKTLWFNYNLFQNELELIGKDCTEERDLIKKWFESRFLNKPKVRATFNHAIDSNQAVDEAIQNGVKNTLAEYNPDYVMVEDTIQNGVKNTEWYSGNSYGEVEETIQNGVKHTQGLHFDLQGTVEDTIQNGVKHTFGVEFRTSSTVENTIQNGVRQIFISKNTPIGRVEDTIQNGVRHVKDGDWLDQDDRIEEIIQN